MTLDSGEKVVKLKTIDSNVPYVPAKSKLSIAVDAFTPALKQLEKNALAVDQANWYNDFIEKTSAQYQIFSEEYKLDPNGMAAATKTYTDNLLDTVPKAFRVQAASILAHKNSAMIGTSTNAYIGLQTDKALSGNLETMNNTAADNSAALSVIFNNDLDNAEAKILKINLETQNNSVARLNNDAHNSQTLVDNGILDQKNHDIYLDQAIKSWTKNRLLAIMQSFDGEDEAFNYLQSWLNGEDLYPVEDQSNAIFVRANQNLKNYETREDIYTEVFTSFNNLRGKKINDLNTNKTYDFEGAIERGGLFHFSNFAFGANRNKALYIANNAPALKASDIKKLDKHLTETYLIQDKAAIAMNGTVVTGLNKKQKEKMFEMIMYQNGIFDSKEILSVEHPKFMTMKSIFKKQGMIPEVWKKYLNTQTGDLKEPAVMKNFRQKLELYNEIKNDFGISELDTTNDFLKYASNNDFDTDQDLISAAEAWASKDKKAISEYVDNIVLKDVSKFMFEISEALDGNPGIISDIFLPFRASISRDLSLSTVLGDGNKYSKVLYPDSFTFFAKSPNELFEKYPLIKQEFAQIVKEQIKLNASNSTFNMYDDKNTIITNATFEALNKMLKSNWSPSKYNEDGEYRLTQNGIEEEFGIDGTALIADAIPHINAWYDGLSAEDKKSALGFKENGEAWTLKEITNVIMDTDSNIIFKPTNHRHAVNNKIGYQVYIKNPNGKIIRITDGNTMWQPDGWDQAINPDAPATNGQLVEWLAQDRKNFIDNWLGPYKPTDPWYEKVTKKASHGVEKMKIKMGDWSWMVDWPFVDDIPNEWKPFKMLFDLGQEVPNLTEKKTELEIQSKKEFDKLNYSEKINLNSNISSTAQVAEALFEPHLMPIRHYNEQTQFLHFVTTNYLDKTLPLTFRTNNYMAVKNVGNTNKVAGPQEYHRPAGAWDGSLNLKNVGNNAAVFAHPADSIRAGVIVMMNMSTIVGTNVPKKYGDFPTIKEILTNYAEDSKIYLAEATKAGFDINESINFQDQDQMHKFIKFMIRHEMGGEKFDKYYPKGNLILDAYIQQGYRNGLNHFAGKLGKFQ